MNNINISELNQQFIDDLAVDYIMECFKYSYIDSSGNESSILDINTDSTRKGLIMFDNNIRDSINMVEMKFYYRNPNGDIILAFAINQLSNLFEFNNQLTNRLFIDLYELTDIINCKFKFFNPQSYVVRQMHRNNFVPFVFDNLSTKFSDTLSFTQTYINDQSSQTSFELRNFNTVLPNEIILNYRGKYYQNNTPNNIQLSSLFNDEDLTIIPDIDYTRINQYNNEEYIIMSSITIPILGEGIPELNYEDSRENYILLSTGLEGGLNPTREMKAIKVDEFVNSFKNVITVWDNTQNYTVGDTVKSPLNHKMYMCILDHTNQQPVYMLDNVIQNRDAGRYWVSYPLDIGSRKLVEASSSEITNFMKIYGDDHICVGHPNKYGGFPSTWSYSRGFLTSSSWESRSVQVDGGASENRYFPKSDSDSSLGRYARMIGMNVTTGLKTRSHAIANNIKMTLPRMQGRMGRWNTFAYKPDRFQGSVFYPENNVGGFSGIKTGRWDNANNIRYDTYRDKNLKNTGTPSAGNIADRTRGNERDFYSIIKVR